jgi:outer membrane immunogenic protein
MMGRFSLLTLLLTSIASGSAAAADMAVKAPPLVPAAAAYNWSGIYIGGTIGGVWTEANRFMPDLPLVGVPPTTFTAHSTDGIYGGVLGAQWQVGPWVLGIEGSYNASFKDMQANVSVSPPEPFTKLSATTLITDLVTIGPRVGYTWDRLMVYGTGGYAGAHLDGRYTCTFGGQFVFPGRAPCSFPLFGTQADLNLGGRTWNNGWFAGIGFEYVAYRGTLADVLLGAEYQHFDLERQVGFQCNPVVCLFQPHQSFLHDANGDIARVRLTIKTHGWGGGG